MTDSGLGSLGGLELFAVPDGLPWRSPTTCAWIG